MPVTWDAGTARYRAENGRFVDRDTVLDLTRQSLAATGDIAGGLATRVSAGTLPSADWAAVLWQEIKDEHIRQYLAGRGGVAAMTQVDWGSVGGSLSDQRRYFQAFVTQVAAGDMSEGEIRRRSQMYINSARESYERGYRRAIDASEAYGRERWVLGPTENCSGCKALAARGWVEIGELGTVPCAGATECKTNCQCGIEYSA